MSEPQILDSAGNRLQAGDRVERRILSGHWKLDVMRRPGWEPQRGWVVRTSAMPSLPLTPDVAHGTYRCPDLKLAPTQEDD